MKDLKTLIAEAKKKAPPLNFASNSGHKSVVLIEEDLHPMLKKLNKHRASLGEKCNDKNDPKDWQNYKHNMIMNLETKRKEEWEQQKEIQKMNDSEEELEELVEDDAGFENDDDDNNDDDNGSQSQSQDDNEDEIEAQDEAEKIFGGDDDEDEEEDEKLSAKEEVEDEEEEMEELIENYDTPDCNDVEVATKSSKSISRSILDSDDEEGENFVSISARKHKLIEDDEEFDDNAMGFDSQSGLEEDKKIDFTSSLYSQGGEAIFNAETGDSNDLLQFCSGQFNTQKFGDNLTSQDDSNQSCSASNPAIDGETISESGNDFEADAEEYNDSIPDEEEDDNELDDNGNDGDDDDDEDELDNVPTRKKKKLRMKDFLEEEAELSGSEDEVSSDESDGEDEYEADEVQEDLPSDDEIRQQVERIYKKQELDEDKRQLLLLQERYLEDGDLHEEDTRVRKFKWNLQNEEDNEFTNILSDSDDDTQSSGDDDYDGKGIIQLKRPILKESTNQSQISDEQPSTIIEKLDSNDAVVETITTKTQESEESTSRVTFSQALESTSLYRHTLIKHKKITKVSSFFVKDDRLKGLLNKRSNPTTSSASNGPGPSKRSRLDDDSSSKSIFDLL